MIRNITINDSAIIKTMIGIDIDERIDINYNLSGVSFNNNGIVDSIIIIGTRTLTEYFNGNVPNNDLMDDSEGSQEIIGYYTADGTDEDMYKTFSPFVNHKLRNWSQCWYVPKDEEDCIKAKRCMNMTQCKIHNMLVKRMV